MESDKLNAADVAAEITDRAGVEYADVPRMDAYRWTARENRAENMLLLTQVAMNLAQFVAFLDAVKNGQVPAVNLNAAEAREEIEKVQNMIGKSMEPIIFRRKTENPLNKKLTIAEMFMDEDEVRLYCWEPPAEPVDPEEKVCARYRLNKNSNTFSVENMSLDVWMDEVAEDFKLLAGGWTAEQERDAVVDYLESLAPDFSVKEAAIDIKEGMHVPDDDEIEEEEEGEEGAKEVEDSNEANGAATQPAASTEQQPTAGA